jgi:hypothetical protein
VFCCLGCSCRLELQLSCSLKEGPPDCISSYAPCCQEQQGHLQQQQDISVHSLHVTQGDMWLEGGGLRLCSEVIPDQSFVRMPLGRAG